MLRAACAASRGRTHPVFGLWPVRLRENLRQAVIQKGVRRVDQWTWRHRLVTEEIVVCVPGFRSIFDLYPAFSISGPQAGEEDLQTAVGFGKTNFLCVWQTRGGSDQTQP